MKMSEIRSLSSEELQDRLASEKDTFQKLKFAHAISPVENPSKIRETRKTIAKIATEIRAREIQNN